MSDNTIHLSSYFFENPKEKPSLSIDKMQSFISLMGLSRNELEKGLKEVEEDLEKARKELTELEESDRYDLVNLHSGAYDSTSTSLNEVPEETHAAQNEAREEAKKLQKKIEELEDTIADYQILLKAEDEKEDRIHNEARKINSLIDFVLENPDNGITNPQISSAQEASTVLCGLTDKILGDLDEVKKKSKQEEGIQAYIDSLITKLS